MLFLLNKWSFIILNIFILFCFYIILFAVITCLSFELQISTDKVRCLYPLSNVHLKKKRKTIQLSYKTVKQNKYTHK